MAVDPWHRYSNESERANEDIYDDFKLKKPLYVRCFFLQIISALWGLRLTALIWSVFTSYTRLTGFEVGDWIQNKGI